MRATSRAARRGRVGGRGPGEWSLVRTARRLPAALTVVFRAPSTVLACVVHCTLETGGEWSVGCTFSRELSDADLAEFGARRPKPPTPGDARSWVRFSCSVQAVCDSVPSNGRAPESVEVLNLSPSGVGLVVPRPIETGS